MSNPSHPRSPESKWFLVAVLATLLAVMIHGYLTYRHMQVSYGDATTASICNMSETYNCDAVAASEYSSFMGIPLAVWGMLTNLILLALAMFYKLTWKEADYLTGRLAVYLSGFVLLMSFIMGAVSFTQLTVYCPFCIAAYGLSVLSFLGFYLSVPGPVLSQFPQDISVLFTAHRGLLVMLIAIPALSWLVNGILVSQFQRDPGRMNQFVQLQVNEWQHGKVYDFSHLTGLALGAQENRARMTIHEFADFRCGHCRAAAPKLHAFTKANSDVRLVFLSYPLDGACNPNMSHSSGISCQLAKTVYCAGKKGWQAHDYIFDHQMKFSSLGQTEILLEKMSESLNIDWQELQNCVNSESVDQEIRRQVDAAANAAVNGTPAVFVNGKRLVGGQDLNVLKEVYSKIKSDQRPR